MANNANKLSHLRNLIILSQADGIVKPEEVLLIESVMARENMSKSDYDYCMNNLDQIAFSVPSDYGERIEYLHDMIRLMMIDGDIDDRELELCYECASVMEIPQSSKKHIIDNMIGLIKDEMEEMGITITRNGQQDS